MNPAFFWPSARFVRPNLLDASKFASSFVRRRVFRVFTRSLAFGLRIFGATSFAIFLLRRMRMRHRHCFHFRSGAGVYIWIGVSSSSFVIAVSLILPGILKCLRSLGRVLDCRRFCCTLLQWACSCVCRRYSDSGFFPSRILCSERLSAIPVNIVKRPSLLLFLLSPIQVDVLPCVSLLQ